MILSSSNSCAAVRQRVSCSVRSWKMRGIIGRLPSDRRTDAVPARNRFVWHSPAAISQHAAEGLERGFQLFVRSVEFAHVRRYPAHPVKKDVWICSKYAGELRYDVLARLVQIVLDETQIRS